MSTSVRMISGCLVELDMMGGGKEMEVVVERNWRDWVREEGRDWDPERRRERMGGDGVLSN